MLTVQNLTSYYSNIKILKDLTFSLRKGKVTCLLGRNGAGKTTTLKSIMGLVDKTEGLISFNDETISEISPHHIPKKGILFSRAYLHEIIFPSEPLDPKPGSNKIPFISLNASSASRSFLISSVAIQ